MHAVAKPLWHRIMIRLYRSPVELRRVVEVVRLGVAPDALPSVLAQAFDPHVPPAGAGGVVGVAGGRRVCVRGGLVAIARLTAARSLARRFLVLPWVLAPAWPVAVAPGAAPELVLMSSSSPPPSSSTGRRPRSSSFSPLRPSPGRGRRRRCLARCNRPRLLPPD